jgi:RNA polymerase sigma-32 factor
MVKIGTSSPQKKLFFNLRRLKAEVLGEDSIHLNPDAVTRIAAELGVNEADVVRMDQRLRHGDESLNTPMGTDEDAHEWQDFLVETRPNQEELLSRREQAQNRKTSLMTALATLDERERAIFVARHLTESEDTPTLETLSAQFGVSRERVRQLEERAFGKVSRALRAELN